MKVFKTTINTHTVVFTPEAKQPWACWPHNNPNDVFRSESYREVADRCKR